MFKTRYSVLGFTDKARLDNGKISPVSHIIISLSSDVESIIHRASKVGNKYRLRSGYL